MPLKWLNSFKIMKGKILSWSANLRLLMKSLPHEKKKKKESELKRISILQMKKNNKMFSTLEVLVQKKTKDLALSLLKNKNKI